MIAVVSLCAVLGVWTWASASPDETFPGRPGPDFQGGRGREHPRPEEMRLLMGMVQDMKMICEDGVASSMLAIGSLKDDVTRKPDEVIDDLEDLLKEVTWLPTRNAIRLTLKDLYKQQGEEKKLIKLMKEMVLENNGENKDGKLSWPKHMFERPMPPVRH
jgi:hypothetical protein